MELFLETIHAADYQELMQFADFKGAITSPRMFSSVNADVQKSIDEMLEVLPENSLLFIPVIQTGFRNILREARELASISGMIVPVIPFSPEGLMALKACYTLKIRAACSKIARPEEAVFALNNRASFLLISQRLARKSGTEKNMKQLLKTLKAEARTDPDSAPEVVVYDFCDLSEASGYLCADLADTALLASQVREILDDQILKNEIEEEKDDWILAYTRMELFD